MSERQLEEKRKLFPFQTIGAGFLAARDSALLADEPGTGKTAQMCTALGMANPVLIVCPGAVKFFWKDELVDWGDYDPEEIAIYRRGDNKNPKFFKRGHKVFILHWEALRLNEDALRGIRWDTVIADEAHRAKNRKSRQSKVLRKPKAERKYALTGTPNVNHEDDIWPILNFLFPSKFRSYWKFMEEHLVSDRNFWGGVDILGYKDEDAFKQMLSHFMIRRLKVDVLPQLPPKMNTTLQIELGPKQRKVYDTLRKEMIADINDSEQITVANALALTTRLRQIACGLFLVSNEETESSKMTAAFEFIDDLSQPVVVFSQFVPVIKALKERYKDLCEIITGEVPEMDREDIVRRFQGGVFPIIGLTLQTGGESYTLNRASTALFINKSWSPTGVTQAEDRLHRIGQFKQVNIVSLQARDTVEERVEEALLRKEGLLRTFSGRELKGLL